MLIATRKLRMPDGSFRQVGDPVPEAAEWRHLAAWMPHWVDETEPEASRALVAKRRMLTPHGYLAFGDPIPADVGTIRERERWLKYGWAALAPEANLDALLIKASAKSTKHLVTLSALWDAAAAEGLVLDPSPPRTKADAVVAIRAAQEVALGAV